MKDHGSSNTVSCSYLVTAIIVLKYCLNDVHHDTSGLFVVCGGLILLLCIGIMFSQNFRHLDSCTRSIFVNRIVHLYFILTEE